MSFERRFRSVRRRSSRCPSPSNSFLFVLFERHSRVANTLNSGNCCRYLLVVGSAGLQYYCPRKPTGPTPSGKMSARWVPRYRCSNKLGSIRSNKEEEEEYMPYYAQAQQQIVQQGLFPLTILYISYSIRWSLIYSRLAQLQIAISSLLPYSRIQRMTSSGC
jgi:hypothetical protein